MVAVKQSNRQLCSLLNKKYFEVFFIVFPTWKIRAVVAAIELVESLRRSRGDGNKITGEVDFANEERERTWSGRLLSSKIKIFTNCRKNYETALSHCMQGQVLFVQKCEIWSKL